MTTTIKPDWVSVIVASIIATVAVTITFSLSGNDIVKTLGMMILGGDSSLMMQYTVGGVMHVAVGLAYGVLFALFFIPVQVWNKVTKGILFGFVITAVALTLMPSLASVFAGGQTAAANPCAPAANPCAGGAAQPCGGTNENPCAMNSCNLGGGVMGNPCASNPCGGTTANPCAQTSRQEGMTRTIAMARPGNPCAVARNPCAASSPCAGVNPSGGNAGGGGYMGMISLLNHLAFALTLSFLTRVARPGAA